MATRYLCLPNSLSTPAEALREEAEACYSALMPFLPHRGGPNSDAESPPTRAGISVDGSAAVLDSKPHHIVKVVQAHRTPFSVALLGTGQLVLLCPTVPTRHGTPLPLTNADTGAEEAAVDIAAGAYHFACCTTSGAVFTFGSDNRYGQLGTGGVWVGDKEERELSPPEQVGRFGESRGAAPVDPNVLVPPQYRLTTLIEAVACGEEHTLLLPSTRNKVYACGAGESGQLGDGAVPLQPSFRSIRLLLGQSIRQVVAAGRHSLVLLTSGRLFAFGDNTCGQLGLGHTRPVRFPTAVPVEGKDATVREGGRPSSNSKRRLLDAKAFTTLRAGYSTVESALYPLRVERLSAEVPVGCAAVVTVWTGQTHTIANTADGRWLSCGLSLPLWSLRGERREAVQQEEDRYDGFGALGRSIVEREDCYTLRAMNWSAHLRQHLGSVDGLQSSVFFYPGLSILFAQSVPETSEGLEEEEEAGGGGAAAPVLYDEGESLTVETPVGRHPTTRGLRRGVLGIQGFPSQRSRFLNELGENIKQEAMPLRCLSEEGVPPPTLLQSESTREGMGRAVPYEGINPLHRDPNEDDSILYDANCIFSVVPLSKGLLVLL